MLWAPLGRVLSLSAVEGGVLYKFHKQLCDARRQPAADCARKL